MISTSHYSHSLNSLSTALKRLFTCQAEIGVGKDVERHRGLKSIGDAQRREVVSIESRAVTTFGICLREDLLTLRRSGQGRGLVVGYVGGKVMGEHE